LTNSDISRSARGLPNESFAPSREVSKEMGNDSREGAKEESDARE